MLVSCARGWYLSSFLRHGVMKRSEQILVTGRWGWLDPRSDRGAWGLRPAVAEAGRVDGVGGVECLDALGAYVLLGSVADGSGRTIANSRVPVVMVCSSRRGLGKKTWHLRPSQSARGRSGSTSRS
jgi:hypothetical protein